MVLVVADRIDGGGITVPVPKERKDFRNLGFVVYPSSVLPMALWSHLGLSWRAALLVMAALLLAPGARAAVATSPSYAMDLDESGIGGGTSTSTNATLRGSAVTILDKRTVGSGSAMFGGFVAATTAANQMPVFTATSTVTTVDTAVTVTAVATDGDGQPLLYGQGSPMPGTMVAFAPNSGVFTWLPPAGATGTYQIPVTVTDGFSAAVAGTVTITVVTPQIVVAPSGTLITSESGSQSSLAIVLNAPPTGAVTVAVASNRPAEVLTSVSSVSFTPSDWSNARTVVLTGQPDGVTDGDQACLILIGPVAAGTNFAGVSGSSVPVINLDQDIPALVIIQSGGSTAVSEGGSIDTYTVALAARPSGIVTVTVAGDPQLVLGTTTLSFDAASWNTPQTVTVNAVDDLLTQGNRSVFIVHSASGGGYGAMPNRTIVVAITDNDNAALVLTPSTVTVSETGTTAQIRVSLASQPNSTVTLAVTSSDTATASISPATLTFVPGAWNVQQLITVTGIDDGNVPSGNRSFSVAFVASGDAGYAGLTSNVAGLCLDNDSKNLVINTSGSLQVSEGSAQSATYTIRLSQAPSASVTVSLANADGYVQFSPASMVFTSSNWSTARTVTVNAVDDAIAQGTHQAAITHSWTSADPGYVSIVSLSLAVSVIDNDTAGIALAPASGLETTEIGGSDLFTVVLTSQPTADVIIPVVSGDSAQATVNRSSLTFTTSTWNVPQTVTVSGADGNAANDGDVAFAILVGAASSADPIYSGRAGGSVTGINRSVDHPPTLAAPSTATVGGSVVPLVMVGPDLVLIVNETPGIISVGLSGISNGQIGETQMVTVSATSDNTGLTGALALSYNSPQSTGQLTFTPVLNANGIAWITITAADGGANPPATRTFKLQVNAVDTPPTVDRSTDAVVAYNGAVAITGLQANAFAAGQLACSDVETTAANLSIILSVAPQRGQLQLFQPLAGTWSALGVGDAFTQQQVDVGYLRYVHTDNTGALNDGLQFTVRDSGNQTAGGAMNFSVDPNKPSVDLLPTAAATFTEGGPDTLVAPLGLLFNPVASLSAGTLVVSASGGDASDVLAIQAGGNIAQSGATVSYGATAIGTVSGSSATLIVTFNASASTAMAQELLRQVVFRNTSENPSAALRTISAVLTNSFAFASVPATRFLGVTPVNDAPTATSLALLASAGVPVAATPVISDPDGPGLAVTVLTAPAKGDLVITNAATGAFSYRAWPGQSGPDAFVLAVSDGATPTPGTTTLSVSIAITGPATVLKPWIYSRPPVEAQAGDLLQWTVQVDVSDLTAPTLSFATSDAPSGLLLVPDLATATAAVSWNVPNTASGDVTITVLVSDSVSGTTAAQVATIFVHPQPVGAQ